MASISPHDFLPFLPLTKKDVIWLDVFDDINTDDKITIEDIAFFGCLCATPYITPQGQAFVPPNIRRLEQKLR